MLDSTIRKIQNERERAVKRAERTDGYREGAYRHKFNGALCRVSVTFYPHRKWWIEVVENGNVTDRRPLTKNLWSRLDPVAV